MSGQMKGWEIRTAEITFGVSPRYGVLYASGSGITRVTDGADHVRRLMEHYLMQAERCRYWLDAIKGSGEVHEAEIEERGS